MPAEIYEIVAQGARYWFLFLMALIVWRSYRWYRRDSKQRKKRLRLLPDAGYIGELVVIKGGDALRAGVALPVPREGTLGYTRMNDLCVPVRGVKKRHTRFRFEPKTGLTMEPFFAQTIMVDGEERTGRRDPVSMGHGSRLYVGEAELRLRLFAGFEAPARFRTELGGKQDADGSGAMAQAPVMTQEQLAQWQQQMTQQQYMQQMAYMQWMASQWAAQGGIGAPVVEAAVEEPYDGEWDDEPPYDGQTYDGQPYDGADAPMNSAPIDGAYENGAHAAACAAGLGASFVPPQPFPQTDFETEGQFYPPVGSAEESDWPYASVPSGAEYTGGGYVWPESADGDEADDDLTDAAAPPKSVYVGHDEAEEAKRRFWDRYLGGGERP